MKIRIVATSDIHGCIFPTNYTHKDHIQNYSLAHIATAVKTFRETETVILVDNGDAFQGTPLLTYAHQHSNEVSNPIASTFNAMNYDFVNLGNHDFNYGKQIFHKYLEEVEAPLLTSNVLENSNPLGSTRIVDINGKKLAFIGVVTHYIPNWERPDHIDSMQFLDAFESLKSEVERVRSSVDFVIAMYHGGLEKDPKTGVNTERQTGENQGYRMLHEIEGIDVLITGHQHRSIAQIINGVAVTQTALKAAEFASVELNLETGEITPHLHKTSEYTPDEAILLSLEELEAKTQIWLDQPLGTLQDDAPSLIVEDPFDARIKKHPLVSFINQVQLDKTGADIASFALFNDASGFKKEISMRDLVCTYLYPNTLVVKRMNGKSIKEMIEFSAHYFQIGSEGQIEVSPGFVSPKPQHYNYDMLDGVEYTLNIAKERGSRIESITVNGNPLKDDDFYDVVMNNYRASGGGNYTMVSSSQTKLEIQEEMVDILMEYIKTNSPIAINHKDNIKIIAK